MAAATRRLTCDASEGYVEYAPSIDDRASWQRPVSTWTECQRFSWRSETRSVAPLVPSPRKWFDQRREGTRARPSCARPEQYTCPHHVAQGVTEQAGMCSLCRQACHLPLASVIAAEGVDRVAKVHLVRREDSRGIAGRIRQDDHLGALESVCPPWSRTPAQLAQRGDIEDGVDAGRGDRWSTASTGSHSGRGPGRRRRCPRTVRSTRAPRRRGNESAGPSRRSAERSSSAPICQAQLGSAWSYAEASRRRRRAGSGTRGIGPTPWCRTRRRAPERHRRRKSGPRSAECSGIHWRASRRARRNRRGRGEQQVRRVVMEVGALPETSTQPVASTV